MPLSKYTYLLWVFNMLIDSGKYNDVTVNKIKGMINDGTIGKYLSETFPNGDFSMITAEEWAYLIGEWQDAVIGVNEAKHMGVVNNGICLLIGYTIDGLQRHPDLKTLKP